MSAAEVIPMTSDEKKAVTLSVTKDGCAVVTLDVPGAPVNTINEAFGKELEAVLDEIEKDGSIRAAVLISGKPSGFIAGADISMIEKMTSKEEAAEGSKQLGDALLRLEGSRKPFVAAIHGAALGGGFELALACHARIVSDDKKTTLGLPEVQLGLLPGADGLQRLARLVGLQVALDHGLTGKNLRPAKAKKLGVADEVCPAPILRDVAIRHALALADGKGKAPKKKSLLDKDELTKAALEKNPLGRKFFFKKARELTRKKTGGHYPAAERIIDVLESYANDGFEASRKVEHKAFGELVMSDVAKRLMEIFFATTAMKKDTGVDDPSVLPREVDKVAVLGAGLMGAGVAYVTTNAGITVRMKDRDDASLARGLKTVADIYDQRFKRKQLSRPDRIDRGSKLSGTTDYSGFGTVDVVIEAVFEDLGIKQKVVREIEEVVGDETIFASNTSSIPIGRIAAASKRPELVVGMHYFSPVHKMPLLEVIKTPKTAPWVVATAVDLGKKQGKTVIVVNDGVGFYTSRILAPYMNEASYLVMEGVSVEDIDSALTAFGWPVGPLTLLDEVGIDVAAHVGPIMHEAFGERMSPPPSMERLIADDRRGRKNGRGVYLYGDAAKKAGKGKKPVDPSFYSTLGVEPKTKLSRHEIQERCTLQFVNEALHCFGEGLLRSARDGDIGAIFGLGFPPFLGGPFRYVDSLGAAEVLRTIEGYRDRFGVRWTPAPVLVEYAKSGKKFYG